MSNHAQHIREKIDNGFIIEAGTLLTAHKKELSNQEVAQFTAEITARKKKADQYMEQSAAAEASGNLQDAIELVYAAAKSVADYPGMRRRLAELQDAITLTGLVKNRSIRRNAERMAAGRRQSPSPRKRWVFVILILLGISSPLIIKQLSPPAGSDPANMDSAAPSVFQQEQKIEQPISPRQQEASLSQQQPAPIEPARIEASTEPQPEAQYEQPDKSVPVDHTEPRTSSPAVEPKEPRVYIVKKNDTLSHIAIDLFCNEQAVEDLVKLNRHQLRNPNEIFPGMQILLESSEISIKNRCKGKQSAKKQEKK
ncbi:LysM peptidoglycan-binding domain-containing protein [Desulfogranum japonicum]|uniref:LysM peptidoglycan-binding domain-containing protein n=1 Tax=Desulfogranum japonicum TaxID=231447 RepID=UPI00040CAAF5|nr:LysM domain-containing protein [Desulfogranum japonicum]